MPVSGPAVQTRGTSNPARSLSSRIPRSGGEICSRMRAFRALPESSCQGCHVVFIFPRRRRGAEKRMEISTPIPRFRRIAVGTMCGSSDSFPAPLRLRGRKGENFGPPDMNFPEEPLFGRTWPECRRASTALRSPLMRADPSTALGMTKSLAETKDGDEPLVRPRPRNVQPSSSSSGHS